jgi:hypothetical protein
MNDGVLRVGVTGHIRLTRRSAPPIFRALITVLRDLLMRHGALHGVTCLAGGADRLFAWAVRDLAGTYEVVLAGAVDDGRQTQRLLRQAQQISHIRFHPRPESRYASASEQMLQRCDLLVAVWDGSKEGPRGGTAHTVALAQELGKRLEVVWPDEAKRLRRYAGAAGCRT